MSTPWFDEGFSTEPLTDVFSARATVAAMLEFEAALAMALAEAGVAPIAEAEAVAEACRTVVTDPGEVLASTWARGTPLILLHELTAAGIDDSRARRWFHYGATTQDTIDSGHSLQAKQALQILDARLSDVARLLAGLTESHRSLPQMGRTFLQDARPLTFGLRAAIWLDTVLGHIEELRDQRRSLVVQLGGPVGTLEEYGAAASTVVASVARALELGVPAVAWQADRSGVLALAHALERCSRSMSKMATDIAILASSSIAEIRVRAGGSSSMPEKRNPIDSVRAAAAASACSGAVHMLAAAPPQQLDRGLGAWQVEWLAVPLVFMTAGAAIDAVAVALDSLEVDEQRMRDNAGGEFTVPEAVEGQIEGALSRYRQLLPD